MKHALYELITHSIGGTSVKEFKGTRTQARVAAREMDLTNEGKRKFGQTTRVRFVKYLGAS